MVAGDHGMHHVEGGGATARGEAVAVDLEEGTPQVEIGILLDQGRRVLPVNREAVAAEDVGAGEEVGSARNAAERHAAPRQMPQPGEGRAVPERGRIAAGADDQPIEADVVADAVVGGDSDAVRRKRGQAVDRDVAPAIEHAAGETVRGPQRFDRRGIGEKRETGDQQEADISRPHGLAGVAPGQSDVA